MANHVCFSYESYLFDDLTVRMANGLTYVFISTFGLSASYLAQTTTQKEMSVFVLEKDQSCLGGGTVGFAIDEMPWNEGTFDIDKQFLLNCLSGIKNRTNWDKLNYKPYEEWLFPRVDALEILVDKMEVKYINQEAIQEWHEEANDADPIHQNFPRCKKHDVFLTIFGCHLCNEGC